jgi:two-component system sensor histidine kinase MtrB
MSRWPSFRGLRARIAVTVVLVTLLATGAVAFTAYQLEQSATLARFSAAAEAGFDSDRSQAGNHIPLTGRRSNTLAVTDFMRGRLGVEWAVLDFTADQAPPRVIGGDYVPTAGSAGVFVAGQLPVAQVQSVLDGGRVSFDSSTGVGPRLTIIGEVDQGLVLAEFYNTRKLRDELTTLQLQLAGIAGVVALFGALAGMVAGKRIQKPVRAVAAAARSFGDGALGTRLPVQGKDEIADLAGSFNRMAQRLGTSIEELQAKDKQQRRFVADVAHDLRTPLASMLAATESLDNVDPAVRTRAGALLSVQARRLARLVEDLLEMSRFDAGAVDFRAERVDLEALVSDAIGLSAPDAETHVEASGETSVSGDPRRLHTIVRNLLTNAVTHGAAPVTVAIDGTARRFVIVRVTDSGPGVPPALRPIVFDRFVRGDQARRETEGSGLGLAIAYENALLHRGTLAVGEDGASFVLTLPRGGQIR